MSVTYKLKKEYPGSPPLNTEVYDDGKNQVHYKGVRTIDSVHSLYVEKTHVNNKEFWQKVEKPDWLITEYEGISSMNRAKVVTLTDNGLYSLSGDGFLNEYELVNSNWKPLAVRRLSDNHEFRVGDYITSVIADAYYKIDEIQRVAGPNKWFKIASFDDSVIITDHGVCRLSKIVKATLYLRTEDGQDIFKSDKIIYGLNKDWSVFMTTPILAKQKGDDLAYPKFFATKTARDTQIMYEKPCLSLWEALSWASFNSEARPHLNLEKLEQLVKTKI